MPNKPIKRSEYIMPLSRDHHAGLLFCWKLRESLKAAVPAARIRPYVAYFWNGHLQEHFREEETLLFGKVQDPLCDEGYAQHAALRDEFEKVIHEANDNNTDFAVLEQLLQHHIRFEERELFPFLESAMSEAALVAAGDALRLAHTPQWEDTYADEFWITKK